MTMSAKIRRALAQGMEVRDIAKKYKVDPNYVHTIRWKDNRKKQEKEQITASTQTPANLPPSNATIDFTFDASSQSFTPVMTSAPTPSESLPTYTPPKPESGIVSLIDKKDANSNPAAVEELTLWERFKLWAFGVR